MAKSENAGNQWLVRVPDCAALRLLIHDELRRTTRHRMEKGGPVTGRPSETISLLANLLSQLFVVVLRLGRELHP